MASEVAIEMDDKGNPVNLPGAMLTVSSSDGVSVQLDEESYRSPKEVRAAGIMQKKALAKRAQTDTEEKALNRASSMDYSSCLAEPSSHVKARSEANAAYRGRRVEVPDELVSWDVEWPEDVPGNGPLITETSKPRKQSSKQEPAPVPAAELAPQPFLREGEEEPGLYQPAEFTAPEVLANGRELATGGRWADTPKPLRFELNARTTYTLDNNDGVQLRTVVDFDTRGAPLNPHGRTGLRGRGLLGQWGPNHAADPIVTRREPLTGQLQLLAILRKDTHEWALPGGMVKEGNSVSATVLRSMQEVGHGKFKKKEDRALFDSLVSKLFKTGAPIYRGYVDDPRNTDNAWMESTAVHFHCSSELGAMLPLVADTSSKAGAVGWLDMDAEREPRYAALYGNHREWAEHAKASMEGCAAHAEQISHEGMGNALKAVFDATYAAQGLIELARDRALMFQCIKTKPNPGGKYVSHDGQKMDVLRFPIRSLNWKDASEYGLSVAVILYLRMALDGIALFLILWLITLPTATFFAGRNLRRNECRALLHAGYANLTNGSASPSCGYAGLGVRAQLIPPVPDLMLFGMGTCSEFGNESVVPRSVLGESVGDDEDSIVELDWSSDVCSWPGGGSVHFVYWVDFLCQLILIAFLVRQKRVIDEVSDMYDSSHHTVGDYAVMIDGLDRSSSPDVLQERLYADLARLGYERDAIDHIEVARECAREARCLRRLGALRVQRQELQARRKTVELVETATREKKRGTGGSMREDSRDSRADSRHSQRGSSGAPKSPPSPPSSPSPSSPSPSSPSPPSPSPSPSKLPPTRDSSGMSARDSGGDGGSVRRSARALSTRRLSLALSSQKRKVREIKDLRVERQLGEAISEQEQLLSKLLSEQHQVTGHAFIVFQKEIDRNSFAQLFLVDTWRDKANARILSYVERLVRKLRAKPEAPAPPTMVRSVASMTEVQVNRSGATLESASHQPVAVQVSQEPSEVWWENLAVPDAEKLRYKLLNVCALTTLIVLSFFVLVITLDFKERENAALEDEYAKWADDETAEGRRNRVRLLTQRMMLSALTASISVITNFLLTRVCIWLSRKERYESVTAFERAIFTKLMPAYIINTMLTPLVVGALHAVRARRFDEDNLSFTLLSGEGANRLINQSWYEAGGIVWQIVLIMIGSAATDVSHCVQPLNLLKRFVLTRFMKSQHKLDALWYPPPMHTGRLYAYLGKSFVIGFIIGPLYPPAYLLSAALLGFTFATSRFAIAFWYERPTLMTGKMMERLHHRLIEMILFALIVKRLAYGSKDGDAPWFCSFLAWLFYFLYNTVVHGGASETSLLRKQLESLDTGGISVRQLRAQGNEIERYVCPKAQVRNKANATAAAAAGGGGDASEVNEAEAMVRTGSMLPANRLARRTPGAPLRRDKNNKRDSSPRAAPRRRQTILRWRRRPPPRRRWASHRWK